jgi:hypothetical protein
MTTLRHWWKHTAGWVADLADDDAGDVPGWALVANHI